jgi:homoserine dehydrogenase
MHAFGQHIPDSKIPRLGIDRINDFDVNFAREKGWRIKLVAHSRRTNPGITAWCLPKFIHKNDVLFSVKDAYNGVSLQSIFSESQFFLGKGAGSHPTGSAVLSDISALSYNYRYEYKKRKQSKLDLQLSDSILKVYIRFQHNGEDIRNSLLTIDEEHISHSASYFTGTIRLNQLSTATWFNNRDVNLIVMQ